MSYKQSVEFQNLYNPIFCSVFVWRFIIEYSKESHKPVPILLLFIALPLVFTENSRKVLPKNKRTSMPVWIRENAHLKVSFTKRVSLLNKSVFDAISYLVAKGIIDVESGGITILDEKISTRQINQYLNLDKSLISLESEESAVDLGEIYKASSFVGRWFGRINSETLIYGLLGVRP